MGCSLSKSPGTESQNAKTPPKVPAPGDRPSFPQPYQDPRSIEDDNTFPLDERDITSVSDEELLSAFLTAPRLHDYGEVIIPRISKHLVIKGGPGVAQSEAENMKFALETLSLPIPKVHHAFTAEIPEDPDLPETPLVEAHFIVMDYIKGFTIDKSWQSLDMTAKETVAQQIADAIEKMQSTILNHMPVGPIGRSQDVKFQGPWFTDYGAGPFDTLKELEDWCNHKIDVGIMVKQLKPETRRFEFKDVVLTHQDLALRNLVLDEDMKIWVIDWGCAGVYPKGFEQAALQVQAENNEYADMVLKRLSDRQDIVIDQFAKIAYGLSTGRAL
ncbi:kinase-like (PK-like) [Fusarium subglutinans]|uniref:Kinase-like (PK-like) n=1 Tax=Gibberella subglutinans TaxID=42677 RepID=A0A8H5P4U3_GIBSU|nr:kinase-like (PK-like) [Fusarium subglutinans]KAF5586390.1 kinase-like (PK-like) [Fusarium subglutinans]